jgi:YHS domain-containing protein
MPTTMVDPICGMVVEPDTAACSCTYAGWTYLFCCQECLDLFQRGADTCVAYLAYSRSTHVGHLCPRQRKSRQPQPTGLPRQWSSALVA